MKNSSGNILFIILIAVALFAALSYAVTQSSRGGGNNTDKETAIINGGVLSQYTSAMRSSILRMVTNNIDPLTLQFNPPSTFGALTSTTVGVFHPQGGTVLYQNAPANVMDAGGVNPSGRWVFSLHFEVANIGTSVAGNADGNDLIAILAGVRKSVCDQINLKHSIPINPYPSGSSHYYNVTDILTDGTIYMDNAYSAPTVQCDYGAAPDDAGLKGKSEGCYYDNANDQYVYYSVLLER